MARVGYRFQADSIDSDAASRGGECSFCVPCRDGCREPGPAILAAVLALPGFHPHVRALRLPIARQIRSLIRQSRTYLCES